MRRNVTTTPLMEAVVQRVQRQHFGMTGKAMTFSQALEWVLRDVEWCTDPKMPAYGRWSPVLHGILRDSLRETSAGPAATPEQP